MNTPLEAQAATLGVRPGSKRFKAAVLFLRPEGASMKEVKEETGAPQRNVFTLAQQRGARTKQVRGKDGLTRYKIFPLPKKAKKAKAA